jgi:hypothetical protein
MPGYYLRYTRLDFYRIEFGAPRDNLTLRGQEGIDGHSSSHYLIQKVEGGWGWIKVLYYQKHITYTGEKSRKVFESQYKAARDADAFQGRHGHTSVICTGKNPDQDFLQAAHAEWQKWEAELGVVTSV